MSGALYQRVTTSWVKFFTGMPKALARPKSASFKTPSRLMRRFCGFKSLWSTLCLWHLAVPLRSWYKKDYIIKYFHDNDGWLLTYLDLVLGQLAGCTVEELLEVLVEELEDERQLFVGVEDVDQADDIRVLQLLQEGNLPDSGTRNSLVIRF